MLSNLRSQFSFRVKISHVIALLIIFTLFSSIIFSSLAEASVTTQEAEEHYRVLTELREIEFSLPEYFEDIDSAQDIMSLDAETQKQVTDFLFEEGFEFFVAGPEDPVLDSPYDCFDYYMFGSVNASITGASTVAAGTQSHFTVSVRNDNQYPLLDAGVYVKVFRQPQRGSASIHEGDVVTQYFALEGLTLLPGETTEHTMQWDVPANAPAGSYRIATFVSSAERFNFTGLPFTDDVVGSYYDFSVTNDREGTVAWRKDQVFLNDRQYYFAAYEPRVSSDEEVRVSAPIYNDTEQAVDVMVTWDLYEWDQQRSENLVRSEKQPVSIAAGDMVSISHVVSEADNDVYLLVGTVKYGEMTHIINVRFVREGIANTRINFPGVMNYPLQAGEEQTVFACFHSTGGMNIVDNGRVELTLTDDNTGRVIHTREYTGPISGNMMATADTFVPEYTYDNFTLTARLFQNSDLQEEVSYTYRCDELRDECVAPQRTLVESFTQNVTENSMTYTIMILLALVTFIGGWWLLRPRPRGMFSLLVGALILGGGLVAPIGPVNVSEAAVMESVTDFNPGIMYARSARHSQNFWSMNFYNRYLQTMASPFAQVRYQTHMFNYTANCWVQPGDHVAVGDVIELFPEPGDITWNAAGNAWDTPRGKWYQNGDFPWETTSTSWGPHSLSCPTKYKIDTNNADIYIVLSVDPVEGTVTPPTAEQPDSDEPLEHLGGNRYRVLQPGPLSFTIDFPETYGYYYSMYQKRNVCYASRGTPQPTAVKASQGNNQPEYRAQFTAVTMHFPIVAQEAALPPNAPVIEGPETGFTDNEYTFNMYGTDPAEKAVAYQIDWTGNGEVDARVPAGGVFVPSGTERSIVRTWSDIGDKTFWVRTLNQSGMYSEWSSHTIAIQQSEGVSLTFEASVDGGDYSASDQTAYPTDVVRLRWDSDAEECTGTNFETDSEPNAVDKEVATPDDGDSIIFSISCTRGDLVATSSLTITGNSVPAPVVTFEHNIDGDWSSDDGWLEGGAEFAVRWNAIPATLCEGINFSTIENATSSESRPLQGPAAGDTTYYGVRCVNEVDGKRSAWTTAGLYVTGYGDVTANLEVRVNGGEWSQQSEVTVSENDRVELQFSSTGATQCEGVGFDTGGETGGIVDITTNLPAQNSTRTFTLTCSNEAGSSAEDSIQVTVSDLPDLEPQNLEVPTLDNERIDFDSVTGNYELTLIFDIANIGSSDTPEGRTLQHKIKLENIEGGSSFNRERGINTNPIGAGDRVIVNERFSNVPVGTMILATITADKTVEQANLDNNVLERSFGLTRPPDPNMELTVSRNIIRSGNTVTISWDTRAEYELNCRLQGPGIDTYTFDPSDVGPTGSMETDPLTSFSNYLLTCLHEATDTEFTADATVEVVPAPQER